LVSRRGEVHAEAVGRHAVDGRTEMELDTIFRISSMTKPITAVATMILVEECKLRLDDSVDRLLPELANRRVLTRLDGPVDETVPARRAITVRDLLTFRMGFGMPMVAKRLPIVAAAEELQITSLGLPKPRSPLDPDEWMRRFGTLPLMHQPGERWMYNTGSYVLGVLIARAARQPLESFFRERIFEPLGMRDTGFTVPTSELARLATCYEAERRDPGPARVHDSPAVSQWATPPTFADAGAGLVSTVDDYLAFGEMLLGGGKRGRQRVLSRPAVETMTTDHLTPEQKAASDVFPGYWESRGWGFGVSIATRRHDIASVPGRFGWDGAYGTSWRSDPKEGLVGIVMTQRTAMPELSRVLLDFWTSVYQAIDD
jgi:CubicO group peptidase (beta-lactamase class C family)